MSEERRLGDALAAQEPMSPRLREKYDQEIKNMLEKRLNRIQKVMIWFSALMAAAMAGGFGWLAVTVTDLPTLARSTFAVGAAFALAWVGMMVRIRRKGTIHLIFDENAQGGWAYGVTLLVVISLLLLAGENPDATRSVFMVVSGLVFFLGGCLSLLLARIQQSEMRTREKMLEIEFRLAELTEAVVRQR